MELWRLIKQFIHKEECERLVKESLAFKGIFYNKVNLKSHVAYLSDDQPNRTSSAYAMSRFYQGPLPQIGIDSIRYGALYRGIFPALTDQTIRVLDSKLDLDPASRVLFNIQEYYGGSERVAKHNDGELLDFSTDAEGNLDIRTSLRPEAVAVLTLVNDSEDGGTTIHLPDGNEETVRGEAGDLLIFNNVDCFHSVEPLKGAVKRDDGLLRMTIGWRSLADKTYYCYLGRSYPNAMDQANAILLDWYIKEWPKQWEAIQNATKKAAF